jgi:hypothetical protein
MNSNDEKKLRDSVSAAFWKIDNGIEPTIFQEDWSRANASLEYSRQFEEKAKMDSFLNILKRNIFSPPILLIAPMCLVIISIFIMLKRPIESDFPTQPLINNTLAPLTSLDPNKHWYATTDELLHVDVRHYETKLVTFVNYDPLSMEIK